MDSDLPDNTGPTVFTVSRLNREARALLESGFRSISVEGELSNLARPRSGHMYFTLKDASAQVRCAMFRQSNLGLAFRPEDGQAVVCRGRLSIYEARGDYQLIVEAMEEAGEGDLQREFERLKRKLAAEGLFDETLKLPLPDLPTRIGVITSPTGAAVRDILHVLARRFPAVPVRVYPVPVQGEGAGESIAAAVRLAGDRSDCDVLIVARGGGSLEDLWAFNEEIVARAIAGCPIPIIAGVGHEIDFTITDFVADLRAPTPSGAAERAVPDGFEWARRFRAGEERLTALVTRRLSGQRGELESLSRRLWRQHPGSQLRQQAQRLDELEQRLASACVGHLERLDARVRLLSARLRARSPGPGIDSAGQRISALALRLEAAARRRLEIARTRLDMLTKTLAAVGPEATLQRGYAIVTREEGAIVRDAGRLTVGESVSVRVARGGFSADVSEIDQDSS
jgi:exodeoxyribonuclease VII large subunit